MASFIQWRRLHFETDELRRCYYLYGPDRILVEQIVDAVRDRVNPHELDYVALAMDLEGIKERDVWAQLNQYPLDPLRKRLVIVRAAERLKHWDTMFKDWIDSRLIPQVVVMFVDVREDLDTAQDHIQRIAKSGRLVKCGPLNEDDAVDYVMGLGDIDKSTAKHLLDRVGGNLYLAANAMRKAAFFSGPVPEKAIDALTEPSPADEFIDLLLRMKKAEALKTLPVVPEQDYSTIIGSINYRLDQLAIMNRAFARRQTVRELVASGKIPAFLIKDMAGYSKHYDRQRTRACISTLALVDSQFQQGARDGLLETLVALW